MKLALRATIILSLAVSGFAAYGLGLRVLGYISRWNFWANTQGATRTNNAQGIGPEGRLLPDLNRYDRLAPSGLSEEQSLLGLD